MKFLNIASSSKGNSTLIYTNNTYVLVDFGITKKRLDNALESINICVDDIDGFVFTHVHSDHISGAHFIFDKNIYAPISCFNKFQIKYDNDHIIHNLEEFNIKDFKITPLALSHDSEEIFGYKFEDLKSSLAIITDTGIIPEKYFKLLENLDYYILESNYDEYMLTTSKRPIQLINRTMSDKGHLSNKNAGYYLSQLIGDKTKEVVLAHLSLECNKPDIALATIKEVIQKVNGEVNPHIIFRCASPSEISLGGSNEN